MIAALAGSGDREATVSQLYGGSGSAGAAADAVYAAIGNVRIGPLLSACVPPLVVWTAAWFLFLRGRHFLLENES